MNAPITGEEIRIIDISIAFSQIIGGILLLIEGIQGLKRGRKALTLSKSLFKEMDGKEMNWMEYILLRDTLERQRLAAQQTYDEGLHTALTGFGFFVLAAFTCHVYVMRTLLCSLLLVELSQCTLLWYNIKEVAAALRKSRIVKMAYGKNKRPLPSAINPENVEWVSLKLHRDKDVEVDLDAVAQDKLTIREQVQNMRKAINEMNFMLTNSKEMVLTKDMVKQRADKLAEADTDLAEAIFTAWIVFLNIIADVFYGSVSLNSLLLLLWDKQTVGNRVAARWGSLAGDIVCIMEPISLLCAPFMVISILGMRKDQERQHLTMKKK